MAEDEIQLNQDQARAGATPRMTRYILGISLPLVIVAFIVIYLIWM